MSSALRQQPVPPRSLVPPTDRRLAAGSGGVRRTAAALLACAALLLPALSGCALVARAFTVAEALDTARDLIDDTAGDAPAARTGGPALATVTGTGDAGLRLNDHPGGGRRAVLPEGTGVTVQCRADGPQRDGPFGPTATWLQVRTPEGRGFMSGAYLAVDSDPAGIPTCPTSGRRS